jgi:hypothetical protein
VKLRALITSLLCLGLAVGATACGNKEKTTTSADTEGVYIDVAGLTYQVQVSRELNPRDVEDSAYLKGLPPGTPPLKPTESWFAVFLKVWNETSKPAIAAQDFRVIDTQYTDGLPCEPAKGCYEPVALNSSLNPFAYTPTQLDPKEIYPPQSSVAYEDVIGGSVLIFRIPYASYDNRPLDLKVKSAASATEGTVRLDL